MQAVDIAPDGTVVAIDYWGSQVVSLYPDATGQLTTTGLYSYSLTDYGEIIGTQYDRRFVNVSIAPDGQTVLVCDIASYTDTQYAQGVFRITSPGVLSLTGVITGLTLPAQSIAFDPSGRKAYLSCNNWSSVDEYDHISVVDITGPGYARLNQDNAAELKPRKTSGQLFGVETIAVAQGRAYVGDPSSIGTNDLQIVNLDDFSVITRTMIPGNVHGVAGFYQPTFYLPDIEKN
jgi:hypothetical protein